MFEQLDYIREEGRFKWNDKGRYKTNIGKYAGTIAKKHGREKRQLLINRKCYNEGAIVWYMEYGNIPNRILYKDGNPLNNHISNLTTSVGDRVKEEGIICTGCELLLNNTQFYQGNIKRNRYVCKTCLAKIRVERKDQIRDGKLRYYTQNKDTILKRNRELRNTRIQYNHFMRQIEAQEKEQWGQIMPNIQNATESATETK